MIDDSRRWTSSLRRYLAYLSFAATMISITGLCVWGMHPVARVRSTSGISKIIGMQLPDSAIPVDAVYLPGVAPQLFAVVAMPPGVLHEFVMRNGHVGEQSAYIWWSRHSGFDLRKMPHWQPELARQTLSWDTDYSYQYGDRKNHAGLLADFDDSKRGILYLYWSIDW